MRRGFIASLILGACALAPAAEAELKLRSPPAPYRSTLVALEPAFEKRTGDKLSIEFDAAGPLAKRIESGDSFDVAIISPSVLDDLREKSKIAPERITPLARVGVGVVVKEGAPKPDISTVDAFKKAVLAAKTISFIDPAYGGSSGIFVADMLKRLGIADQVKPKERLKQGGAVADLIASGVARLGIHQISEILPVKGVTLVGPLPPDIQNYTIYAAGVGAASKQPDAAKALIAYLSGPDAAPVLKQKGMEPAAE